MPAPDTTANDIVALQAALAAERLARQEAEARASGAEAMVAHLKLLIAKLKHDRFGASSERGRKLIDQLELELSELVAAASEDGAAAETAAGKDKAAVSAGRRQTARAPLPQHLPRERVVIPAPAACPCCGGRLAKLGEDITETLEVVPRQWKVIQSVRERFSCRSCEAITQPPAPFHPIARGRAGPNLLAMILEAKFGQHLPLNRQSETFAREGIELSVSTLADWVGACAATLTPLMALIEAHVLAAERLHGDDTTVPLMAKDRTVTARLWTYVRDDRPFAGPAPPAAMFRYSRDRTAEHPKRHLAAYGGILQADAYAGFNDLYAPGRKPSPITEAACWAHGRRKLFKLAEVARAPLAAEAVRRIDAIRGVVLLALHMRLDELWRHGPHLVAELAQLATPMVRGVTGFHADQRRGSPAKNATTSLRRRRRRSTVRPAASTPCTWKIFFARSSPMTSTAIFASSCRVPWPRSWPADHLGSGAVRPIMPASPTNRQRPSRQACRSCLMRATVATSAVLPGSTHERTGMPSRVTAMAMTTCGLPSRPSLLWPSWRDPANSLAPHSSRCSSGASISKYAVVVS